MILELTTASPSLLSAVRTTLGASGLSGQETIRGVKDFTQGQILSSGADLLTIIQFFGGSGATVANLSSSWQSTYTTVSAFSASWGLGGGAGSDTVIRSLTGNWQSTYTTVTANSGNWGAAYTTTNANSGNWGDAYTTTNTNSSNWGAAYTTTNTNSGNWNSAYTTTNTNSSNWMSTYTTVCAFSGGALNVNSLNNYLSTNNLTLFTTKVLGNVTIFGYISALSSFVINESIIQTTSAYNTLISAVGNIITTQGAFISGTTNLFDIFANNINSGRWNSVYTTTNANSSNWSAAYTTTNANSSNWGAAYTTTNANSGSWNSVYTTTNTNSGNWGAAYTTTNANSSNWGAVYTTTNANSGNWRSTSTTVTANSGNWNSAYTTTNANSGNWGAAYTTTNTNSSNWQSTFTTVCAFSASWATGGGIGSDTTLRSLTSNWQNTYTEFSTNSSTYVDFLTLQTNYLPLTGGTITDSVIVTTNTNTPALRVIQLGTGNALRVEDTTDPDITPFVITDEGRVGIGVGEPSFDLEVFGETGYGTIRATGSISADRVFATLLSGDFIETTGVNTDHITISSVAVLDTNTSNTALRITQRGTGEALRVEDSTNPDNTPFVITSTGQIIVGSSTAIDATPGIHFVSEVGDVPNKHLHFLRTGGDSSTEGNRILFLRAGGTASVPTVASANFDIGGEVYIGYSGTSYLTAAYIRGEVASAPTTTSVPGRLTFATTQAGSTNPVERMRITDTGNVGINTTTPNVRLTVSGIISSTNNVFTSGGPVVISSPTVESNPSGMTSISNIIAISQSAYNSLTVKRPDTFYIIT